MPSSSSLESSTIRNGLSIANHRLMVLTEYFSTLSRYTHRIAISNNRILKVENGKVTFLWRDYADGDKQKVMTVDAEEFIRRLLPDRYVKIRHFGLLANRKRKHNIELCRLLLGSEKTETIKSEPKTWQELMFEVSGVDVSRCPVCRKGRMVTIEVLHQGNCNGPPIRW